MTKKFMLICLVFFLSVIAWAGEDATEYAMAVKAAKKGSMIFSYMHYRKILIKYPDSPYREKALFAKGEYFALIPDRRTAKKVFAKYLEEFPDAEGQIFARAHLLNIAHAQGDEKEIQRVEKSIIDFQQSGFVFREYKEVVFRSPLEREYKARFYIDKIEFYADNKIFAQMVY